MRQISGGHEIRPRGGLLLVTTLHFYLHRYFPVAIDRSMREHSLLENLHMGNLRGLRPAQTASQRTVRPAEKLLGDGGHPWQAGVALLPSLSLAYGRVHIRCALWQPL